MKTISILPPLPAFAVLGLLAAASVVAVAAANAFGGAETARPLTISKTSMPLPAFGTDDEDCVLQTRRSVLESGQSVVTRKVVCIDIDDRSQRDRLTPIRDR